MSDIIGITGAIGSGKSTFATFLSDLEPSHAVYETSGLIIELAADFNRALSGELAFETTTNNVELVNQALIWFVESISEHLHTEATWNQLAITPHLQAAHPELFEKIFTYVDAAKAQPSLLDAAITAANKPTYRPLLQWLGGYLIARLHKTIWYDELFRRIDLHDSDKNLVIVNGLRYPSDAEVVRLHGGRIIAVDRPLNGADTTDMTEASRSEITPDCTVHNNGTPAQLQLLAEQFRSDMVVGKLRASYSAQ